MILDCAYRTQVNPENRELYEKIQKLADIKINNAFSQDESVKKVIKIAEEYLILGKSYDLEEVRKLSETVRDEEQKQVIECVRKILL